MGKRKNKSKQAAGEAKEAPKTNGVAAVPAKEEKKNLVAEMIENGSAPSARQAFFKGAAPKEGPKVKHYEKFKNKKKRICDGGEADRIDAHRHGKGIKRRNEEEEPSQKRKKIEVLDEEDDFDVLADVFASKVKKSGKAADVNGTDDAEKTDKKKRKNKKDQNVEVSSKKVSVAAEVDESCYFVEEPESTIDIPKKNGKKPTFPNKSGVKLADLFDDMEEGDLDEFVFDEEGLDEMDEEVDEEVSDEDVDDEELFAGLEDEDLEEEEISADEMHIDPSDIDKVVEDEDEPYGSPYSSCEDEEELDDEEVSDEEHDGCGSCCSDVSEQDAASDGEGNLGEQRPAGVVNQGSKAAPIDFDSLPFNDDDSTVTATRALAWMINSCDVQTFFNEFYQSNCLVVKRNNANYYGNLFSAKRFSDLLDKHYVEYGNNINVAEYKNSVRVTPNGKGRAYARQIKAHLKKGRSVQMVNPQAFDDHIWYLCEVLQEVFGCFVGANTYLTPAGSAGFAPHWDDIDAFLLQVEGKKYWKVFAPKNEDDELPRESSGNFTEADMKKRKPTWEGWLEAGDMLYIPRGFIHQAHTAKDVHSLHVTVSTGRQWTFADLMDKLVPEAISLLSSQRLKMRRGLPIGLLDMNGVADYSYKMEEYFIEKFVQPLDRHMSMLRNCVQDHCQESAVDIMAREFMKTALPPFLTPDERKFSIMGIRGEDLLLGNPIQFHEHIYIRFMRRHGQRLVFETEDSCFLAHRYGNSRLYEGREEQTIDIPIDYVPAINVLLDHYPEWTKVGELVGLNQEQRRELCQTLYDGGLLLAKTIPLGKKKKNRK